VSDLSSTFSLSVADLKKKKSGHYQYLRTSELLVGYLFTDKQLEISHWITT